MKKRPNLVRAFIAVVACLLLVAGTAVSGGVTDKSVKHHRVVFQLNENDEAAMRHAISNSVNLSNAYREKNEPIDIEIVAYGAGINMFRMDTSPVREALQFLHVNNPNIAFIVCGNTKAIMEKKEGHPIMFIDGVRVVPFGIVRIVELQEAGWSYIRP